MIPTLEIMMPSLERANPTVRGHLKQGWRVDYLGGVTEYILYAPSGSAFNSENLRRYTCSFCDFNDPNWEEAWCDHSEELLAEEEDAETLLNLIYSNPDFQQRNLG